MGLAKSSYYQSRKTTQARLRDEDLAQKIARIQQKHFYTIGRRRMGSLLKKEFHVNVGQSRLQRIMSRYGLSAHIRQVKKAKPRAGRAYQKQLPDNLLNRQFKADRPFHRLVTDVTYVPYFEEGQWHWGYLSLVQDLFDRSIVTWVYSKKHDNVLAERTVLLLSFKPLAPGAMLHSDRGCLYTTTGFRDRLVRMGVTQSFSRTGNCHDNATMECFNGTFKVEALYNPLFAATEPSFQEQNSRIARYIHYYNEERPCSIIDNSPPVVRRNQYFENLNSVSSI